MPGILMSYWEEKDSEDAEKRENLNKKNLENEKFSFNKAD